MFSALRLPRYRFETCSSCGVPRVTQLGFKDRFHGRVGNPQEDRFDNSRAWMQRKEWADTPPHALPVATCFRPYPPQSLLRSHCRPRTRYRAHLAHVGMRCPQGQLDDLYRAMIRSVKPTRTLTKLFHASGISPAPKSSSSSSYLSRSESLAVQGPATSHPSLSGGAESDLRSSKHAFNWVRPVWKYALPAGSVIGRAAVTPLQKKAPATTSESILRYSPCLPTRRPRCLRHLITISLLS